MGAVALVGSGCAERGLTAQPEHSNSAFAWLVVWVAGAGAALAIGVLLTLPAWRARGGSRLAVTILTVQTGVTAVAGLVLTAVALRSRQLVDRPQDAAPAIALLHLSRVDGNASFLLVMAMLVGALTIFATALAAATARLAAGTDPWARSVATAVLAVELGIAGYLMADLVLGNHGLPYIGGALAFPVLLAAAAACWPRPHPG